VNNFESLKVIKYLGKQMVTVLLVHIVKSVEDSRDIAPLILNTVDLPPKEEPALDFI